MFGCGVLGGGLFDGTAGCGRLRTSVGGAGDEVMVGGAFVVGHAAGIGWRVACGTSGCGGGNVSSMCTSLLPLAGVGIGSNPSIWFNSDHGSCMVASIGLVTASGGINGRVGSTGVGYRQVDSPPSASTSQIE